MRPTNLAARTAHLAISANSQQHVCRACLSRQFHSTPQRDLDPKSFFGEMTSKIFGTKETKKAEERRDVAKEEHITNQEKAPDTIAAADNKVYKIAKAPAADKYEAAKTWTGLPRIGGDAWAKKQGMEKTVYVGFKRQSKNNLSEPHFKNVLYHTTVEVLALHQQGRDVSNVCFGRDDVWSFDDRVRLVTKDGVLALESESEAAIRDIAAAIRSSYQEKAKQSHDALCSRMSTQNDRSISEETGLPVKRPDSHWGPFANALFPSREVKLAILKRIMQLTGHTCPDRSMTDANSLSGLYGALTKRPPPAKLAQDATVQALSRTLPNVTIYAKKRTRTDAEEAIGRQKLIDKELALRDLHDASQTKVQVKRLAARKAAVERKIAALRATPAQKEAMRAEALKGLHLVGERPGEARPGVPRASTLAAPKLASLREQAEKVREEAALHEAGALLKQQRAQARADRLRRGAELQGEREGRETKSAASVG